MNSSFGTTVARHRRPHFRHCLASGPLADQLCTSRFGEREISTTIYWGLLKQPDNQMPATCVAGRATSGSAKRPRCCRLWISGYDAGCDPRSGNSGSDVRAGARSIARSCTPRFLLPTSTRSDCHACPKDDSTNRTAVCGPACTVVWQGRTGDRPPYADSIASQPKPADVSDVEWASRVSEEQNSSKAGYEFLEGAAYGAIAGEQDPGKRMTDIEKFTPAFPKSQHELQVSQLALYSLQQLNQPQRVEAYGEKTLAANPDSVPTLLMLANAYAEDPKQAAK